MPKILAVLGSELCEGLLLVGRDGSSSSAQAHPRAGRQWIPHGTKIMMTRHSEPSTSIGRHYSERSACVRFHLPSNWPRSPAMTRLTDLAGPDFSVRTERGQGCLPQRFSGGFRRCGLGRQRIPGLGWGQQPVADLGAVSFSWALA